MTPLRHVMLRSYVFPAASPTLPGTHQVMERSSNLGFKSGRPEGNSSRVEEGQQVLCTAILISSEASGTSMLPCPAVAS